MKTTTACGLYWSIFVLLTFGTFSSHAATRTLLNFGGPWRYHDYGTNAGANWNGGGYADGNWKFNFAPFGYGRNEQTELAPVTTAYFRTFVTITNPQEFLHITLRVLRDDGVAVYVNGSEVLRDNLPSGPLSHTTLASLPINPPNETTQVVANLLPSAFIAGVNLIAVEVHNVATNDPDLNFNLQLVGTLGGGGGPASIVRGPYLQVGTSSNIIVRWRTSVLSDTQVRYGTDVANLNLVTSNTSPVLDHEIMLNGLLPDTKYYYSIGTTTQALASGNSYFFNTAPEPGTHKPTRIWVIGDFGTGYGAQRDVRDAYANFTADRTTDVWLMLGDNAYGSGLDEEYQSYVFNVYPTLFRQTVVWPAVGNHDTAHSQSLSDDYDYYRIFTMPTNGQAGGVPSGSEHYYSFDYANIHFICLDSMTAIFRQPNSAMLQWLEADLAENTRDWIIAYWHHPAYTKGSHNSDTEFESIEMRQNVVPILEAHGVDMVFAGHSHCYERSFLIDGHYGHSSTTNAGHFVSRGDGRTNGTGPYFKPGGGMGDRRGTIYIVDGSSGGQGGGGSLNHPIKYYSVLTPGSVVLDVHGLRLDAKFISGSGTVDDWFTILKEDYPGAPRPSLKVTRAGNDAVISWPTSVPDYRLERRPDFDSSPWLPVNADAVTNGRRKSVSLPVTEDRQFFQLKSVP